MLLPRLAQTLAQTLAASAIPGRNSAWKKLVERATCFQDGLRLRLLKESQTSEAHAHQASSRRRRNQVDRATVPATSLPMMSPTTTVPKPGQFHTRWLGVRQAYHHRWSSIMACAAARALRCRSWRSDPLWGRLRLLLLVATCHLIQSLESSAADQVCTD